MIKNRRMNTNNKQVLVVDDSVFARKIVSDIINNAPGFEVAGTAHNGKQALSLIPKLKPDVVTLDIEMPVMNGIETLRRIMQDCPTPVVMLSSLTTQGAQESMAALSLGAVDVMAKPHGAHSIGLSAYGDELIAKITAAANVDLRRLELAAMTPQKNKIIASYISNNDYPVVIIASSTGGPRALRSLVPGLSSDMGAAYVVVQHLPESFSSLLADDLKELTDLNVREASDGDTLKRGDLLVAKAGWHLVFKSAATVELLKTPVKWGVRPSADITMLSAVPFLGQRLIGVVLTGMGKDGAEGLQQIKMAGGTTIAEHESTCVVYGMPKAAIELKTVDIVAPLNHIAEAVNASIHKAVNSVKN